MQTLTKSNMPIKTKYLEHENPETDTITIPSSKEIKKQALDWNHHEHTRMGENFQRIKAFGGVQKYYKDGLSETETPVALLKIIKGGNPNDVLGSLEIDLRKLCLNQDQIQWCQVTKENSHCSFYYLYEDANKEIFMFSTWDDGQGCGSNWKKLSVLPDDAYMSPGSLQSYLIVPSGAWDKWQEK